MEKQVDGRTDAGEITLRKALLRPTVLMIRVHYAKVSCIPSAYSYQGSSITMVAICGPIGMHRAPCGSYMRKELYAALHCDLHFIDSKYSCRNWSKMMLNSPSFSSREGELQEEFGLDHGFLREMGYLWERLTLSLLFGRHICPQMWPEFRILQF